MSVVPYRQPEQVAAIERPWIGLLESAAELAAMIADTEFVPKALRGNRAAIAAAVLYGDEVNIGPMQSLSKVRVIDGTPSVAAETQRGQVLAAGHEIWWPELSSTRVTIAGRRKGEDTVTAITWTLDDARRAGLAGRRAYREFPRQMLMARASADLCRAIFADVIGGLRATEELEDGAVAPEAPAVAGGDDTAATAPTTTRRRRRTTPLVPVGEAPLPPVPDEPPPPPLPGDEPDEGAPVPRREPPSSGGPGTAAEPPEPDRSTEAQRRKLHALFRERGITDRAERLAFASKVLQRDVPSSTDLTVDEASTLIDVIELFGVAARAPQAARPSPTPDAGPDERPAPERAPSGSPDLSPNTLTGEPAGFIDSLDFGDEPQPPLPLPDDRIEAVRAALDGMDDGDRTDLLGLLRGESPTPGGRPYLSLSADPASVIADHWPVLPATVDAMLVLRDQLADVQRMREP